MTLVWPSKLPHPKRDGYQRSYGEARSRRPAETGPGGSRRRFSAVSDPLSLAFELSALERGIFERFFLDTTKRGSLPFRIKDYTRDGWKLLNGNGVPVLNGFGQPVLISRSLFVRFADQLPVETVIGIRFRIAFSLEILP